MMKPDIYSTEQFEAQYTYSGSDLGAVWTKEKTRFRLWAPTAIGVRVNLYKSGTPGTNDRLEQISMRADVNGTWVAEKAGDLHGVYYTYEVAVNEGVCEACDPYARAVGVNGQRAMVIDLSSTDPEGWACDKNPHEGANITDAVIYELHIRDLSADESSGIIHKGKFLGLTEHGTKNANGDPTGLDHIKALGITHLHLLPVYDYATIDEADPGNPQYNWGYDPLNYNVPEGSYSTDPFHGEVRVREMKQMVQALHESGISVVMDVVYNHVYNADTFCFNRIVPGYFSRTDPWGNRSNGSGCGNDTASERSMVKKYIVDSVKYWADEYHIDGFRFDLVGLIDTETINTVIEEVRTGHPDAIFYGEGWSMSTQLTKSGYAMTTQANSTLTPDMAFFSDTLRDLLRGSVFNNDAPGFAAGAKGLEEGLKQCFLAHPHWCRSPAQSVNYASCHDNMALFDRITQSTPGTDRKTRIRMNRLAAAVTMLCQGIPFLMAGEELLRSKPLPDGTFDHNSYRSPDSVNAIKWDTLAEPEYRDTCAYYQGLIAFRKAHPLLRLTTARAVADNVAAIEGLESNVVAFHLHGETEGELSQGIYVVFNGNPTHKKAPLPAGKWNVNIDHQRSGTDILATVQHKVTAAPYSAVVLTKEPVFPRKRK